MWFTQPLCGCSVSEVHSGEGVCSCRSLWGREAVVLPIMAAMAIYQGAPFKNFWSQFCGSVDAMRRSIDTLNASPDIDVPTLEYGQYQPILVPLQNWVDFGSQHWAKETGGARLHLTQ